MGKVLIRAAAATALVAGTGLAGGSVAESQAEQSAEFAYTGEVQAFTVPADVCSITVDAFGAAGNDGEINEEVVVPVGLTPAGASFNVAPGGLGGQATATVDVTPGEQLQVYVGGQGFVTDGGFNGGGDGGDPGEGPGGGGGGASDVRRGSDLAGRLVVAGGGGGGGAEGDGFGGDGGGATGDDGTPSSDGSAGGGGGTQSAGGAAPATDPSAEDGSLGLGGAGGIGDEENDGAGGGGGGYYGGGGGAGDTSNEESDDGGGGGGGSGFGPAGVSFQTGVNDGDGAVTLTWTVEPGCGDAPTTSASTQPAAAVRPTFTG
jgi:hypothetical protein